MNDPRKELSVFLKRQEVRRKRDFGKRLRQLERALLSSIIVIAGLAAVYGIYLMVFMGQTFAVKKIVVEGKRSRLTASGMAELSGVKEGDNLFWINIGDVKERLKQEPWVRVAAVQRRLPDTLWIYVEEFGSAAIVVGEEGFRYVDAEGYPFKNIDADDEKDFPLLTGIGLSAGGYMSEDDGQRAAEMLKLAGFFSASNFGGRTTISEVHYDNVKGYSIVTRKGAPEHDANGTIGPMQILFGHASFEERIAEIDKMIGEITSRPGRIQYMLANEPKRIIVRYGDLL